MKMNDVSQAAFLKGEAYKRRDAETCDIYGGSFMPPNNFFGTK